MANVFLDISRNVIPNWRSFIATAHVGELSSTASESTPLPITATNLIHPWRESPNISLAAELISFHILSGNRDSEILESAEYVLQHPAISSELLLEVAHRIKFGDEENVSGAPKIDVASNLEDIRKYIHRRVAANKRRIYDNPANPIYRIDKARYYTILGQIDKAQYEVELALRLAPNNRFVLRSAVRFFLHADKYDLASFHLNNTPLTKSDSWLLASQIALSTMADKTSRHIKLAEQMARSQQLSAFDLTELRSALATNELHNGTLRRTKALIRDALLAPNDNSLAQATWLSQKNSSLEDVAHVDTKLVRHSEASARQAFIDHRYREAWEYTYSWFKDTPFARTPVIFGIHVATTFLDEYDNAINLGKQGLVANPGDATILNNIAYACCLKGDMIEARVHLEAMALSVQSTADTICGLATTGLYYIKSGEFEKGKEYYDLAIQRARDAKLGELELLAKANLVREISQQRVIDVDSLMTQIKEINDETKNLATKKITMDALGHLRERSTAP